jgi:hypothetical protein
MLRTFRLQTQNDTPEKTDSAAQLRIISFDYNTKLTFPGVTRGKYL